jgi:hypothetical protein
MKKQLKIWVFSTAFAAALPTLALAAGMLDLPRTGQTRCYDTAGTEITCAGSGQDAEQRTGAAIPTPRFLDNGNGTVTDKVTGLIWLKNASCATVSPNGWAAALTSVAALANGACGLSDGSKAGDWRLPNLNEVKSIIDKSKVNPALQLGNPFDNVTNSWYWTSSTYAGRSIDAWYVYFGSGVADYSGCYGFGCGCGTKCGSGYVWPVRAGQ